MTIDYKRKSIKSRVQIGWTQWLKGRIGKFKGSIDRSWWVPIVRTLLFTWWSKSIGDRDKTGNEQKENMKQKEEKNERLMETH